MIYKIYNDGDICHKNNENDFSYSVKITNGFYTRSIDLYGFEKQLTRKQRKTKALEIYHKITNGCDLTYGYYVKDKFIQLKNR